MLASCFVANTCNFLSFALSSTAYEDRCKILKWNTLEKRREFLSLAECYKTVFGLNGISFEEVFEYKQYRATRTNHTCGIHFILNDQESIALNILFL